MSTFLELDNHGFSQILFWWEKMYINLDDKPVGKNLGVVDTDDEHYNKKVNRIYKLWKPL